MALPEVGGPLLWAYVAFASVLHVIEQYLEVRQLRKNRETEPPPELIPLKLDAAKFKESQVYQTDKRLFGFFRDNVNFAWDKLALFVIAPFLWQVSVDYFGKDAEYKATLCWLFLQGWVDKPKDIPMSLYSNFVIEERHGFNKMTIALFFTDMVKSELLSYFFGGLLIPPLIWIVRYFGENAYIYLWVFVQFLILAMMTVYPNFIQPLFNKFEPLKDEDLRKKIEDLAATVQFPLTKLFQIDGSKRSGHSNAYFFGFWKYKRIVLYDTLLHLKHENILAILCHELGHWSYSHMLKNLCISSTNIFVLFWLYGKVMYSSYSKEIVKQFGYGDSEAVMVSLMIFMMLYSPTQQLLGMAMTVLSRTFEFQADSFAHKMGYADPLCAGLFEIHEENKGDLNPDPWYAWYHFSHPPLVERLRAMKVLEEKSGGGKKEK
jgi:STE24 endopeptidase